MNDPVGRGRDHGLVRHLRRPWPMTVTLRVPPKHPGLAHVRTTTCFCTNFGICMPPSPSSHLCLPRSRWPRPRWICPTSVHVWQMPRGVSRHHASCDTPARAFQCERGLQRNRPKCPTQRHRVVATGLSHDEPLRPAKLPPPTDLYCVRTAARSPMRGATSCLSGGSSGFGASAHLGVLWTGPTGPCHTRNHRHV